MNIGNIVAVLLMICVIGSGIFDYYCFNNNGGLTVGEITSINGRDTNDVEYAHYFYEILNENAEPIRHNGSSMIVGLLKDRNSIVEGKKFVVIYCKILPRVSRMYFKEPSDAEIGTNLDLEYNIDTMRTRFIDL